MGGGRRGLRNFTHISQDDGRNNSTMIPHPNKVFENLVLVTERLCPSVQLSLAECLDRVVAYRI